MCDDKQSNMHPAFAPLCALEYTRLKSYKFQKFHMLSKTIPKLSKWPVKILLFTNLNNIFKGEIASKIQFRSAECIQTDVS